eukprot:gene9494-biopygen1665
MRKVVHLWNIGHPWRAGNPDRIGDTLNTQKPYDALCSRLPARRRRGGAAPALPVAQPGVGEGLRRRVVPRCSLRWTPPPPRVHRKKHAGRRSAASAAPCPRSGPASRTAPARRGTTRRTRRRGRCSCSAPAPSAMVKELPGLPTIVPGGRRRGGRGGGVRAPRRLRRPRDEAKEQAANANVPLML